MKLAGILLLACAALPAQPPAANYDEAKVPAYTLPDVLGKAHDAKSWETRRNEILELYRREVFGRAPGKPAKVGVEVSAEGPALGGKAARKIVTLSFGGDVKARMLMYLPAGTKSPTP